MKFLTPLRVVAATSAMALVLAACSSGDDDNKSDDVNVLGTDGNTGQAFADTFSNDKGALVGMRGTTPLSDLSDEFKNRLLAQNADLRDYSYAGESYDAVVISALAAEIARSTEGATFAPFINGVTTKGEKCETYAECKALVADGKDIDYQGASGPLEFTEPGEPSIASFGVIGYDKENKAKDPTFVVTGDDTKAVKESPEAPAQSTPIAGGALTVGALLPQTGGLGYLGPPMYEGVRLAVNEINNEGGVGGTITLVERDDGTDPNVAGPSADSLLQAEVDIIVGAAGSTVSKSVLEKITGAGVVMISPSNTSDEFTTIADNGLYFRTAPPDVLQSRPLANMIVDDGADRVVIMYQNTSYGEGLAKNVQKNLEAADVPKDDILLIAYDEKGRDFSAEVNKAADHDPEYIVVVGYVESASIVKKLNEKGIGPKR